MKRYFTNFMLFALLPVVAIGFTWALLRQGFQMGEEAFLEFQRWI